jgi:hypothetical protein
MGEARMGKRPLRHHSFILTLWPEGADPPVWRFSLQDPHSTERRGFKDVGELVRYLEGWTAVSPSEETGIEE